MNHFKKIKKKGYTNIELLLVVGIMSVLTGVLYFVYDSANNKRTVSAEVTNLNDLIRKLGNATTSSNYANLTNQTLNDFGINYKSEFQNFEIKGLSNNSFQVKYDALTARQCNDLTLKSTAMKGEYIISRKINGQDSDVDVQNVVNKCDNNFNDVELIFTGLSVPVIASVTPGTPKPPPIYAGEGTLNPAYPDRGDVPTNLDSSGKNVSNPNKPIPGTYVPPTYVAGINPSLPGGFVRPTAPPNNPLGPLYNPPDLGNEWTPAIPPKPPRPPATTPQSASKYIYSCNAGYAQYMYLCDDSAWIQSSVSGRQTVATWSFIGFDSTGQAYGRVTVSGLIWHAATGQSYNSPVMNNESAWTNWRMRELGSGAFSSNAIVRMPLYMFNDNLQGWMNFTNQDGG